MMCADVLLTAFVALLVLVLSTEVYFKSLFYVCFIVIGTMSEINQLRIALQESATARNVAEGQCISLKVDRVCCL